MRHSALSLPLVALVGAFGPSAPTPALAQSPGRPATRALSTTEIAARSTKATVTIIAIGAAGDTIGLGSGFFVRSTGVLVTNWHVMAGAAQAVVLRENGERFDRVTFVDGDSAADLAILKVPGYGLPVLETRADVPAVGERVVAIGSPLGLSHTVTEGIVSARRVVDGRELVQMSAAISPGSSGGAVLDASGRVFAVSTSYLNGGQQLNFAVPIRYALGLLSGTLSERPLASAFGGSGRTAGAVASAAPAASVPPAGAPLSGAEHRVVAPPLSTPTRSPTLPLEGSWLVTQRWYEERQGRELRQAGFLFAKDRVGVLVVIAMDEDGELSGRTRIYGIETWRGARDGQVAMAAGGVEYGGHQTAQGFELAAVMNDAEIGAHWKLRLSAVPERLPISENSGLYEMSMTTQWYGADDRLITTTPKRWRGDLAIGVGDGRICIDLYATAPADVGQPLTTAMYGCSAFDEDGTFRIASSDERETLEGSVRAGVLRARWTLSNERGDRLTGPVDAVRR